MRFATFALAVLLAAPAVLRAQTPAEDFIEAGHWKRARALVESRLREAPNDPLAVFLMSQINFAFGHKEAPLDLAEKAVTLGPGVAKFHRQLAEALGVKAQRSNLFQQAFLARRFKKEIDAALAIDPNDVQAQRDLMEYYLLAPGLVGGDRKQAEAVAERISRIDRGQGFLAQARIAQFEHDPAREESMLRKAVEAAPSKYKIRVALAQFYTKERVNWDAAAENARAAIEIDPTRADGYSILAAAYVAQGKWPELEATLAEADRNVPDDLTPYFRAAEAAIAAGNNYVAAKDDLRKYLSQEPEGNQPTLADARQKLAEIPGSTKASSSHEL
jgi:tetratricopeptide (TPR) repeat protein